MGRPKNYVDQAPKISLRETKLSRHAIDRALDMAVDGEEIRLAIESPEWACISRKHEAWMFQHGRITLGLRPHNDFPGMWAVITVLWSSDAEWLRDAAIAPPPEGRDLLKTLAMHLGH